MASGWDALEKANGKKIFVWHLNGMENMPCGAAYNNDEKRLWPGEPGDCLDHKRYADTLKQIGFDGDVCTIEVFRPDYYKLSNEENIKRAAEVTRAHVEAYCCSERLAQLSPPLFSGAIQIKKRAAVESKFHRSFSLSCQRSVWAVRPYRCPLS